MIFSFVIGRIRALYRLEAHLRFTAHLCAFFFHCIIIHTVNYHKTLAAFSPYSLDIFYYYVRTG